MDIDAMLRAVEEEEKYYEESEEEAEEPLFFMEHNHDQIRAQEDSDTQDYWEAGVTSETINALKQGNIDHSQKVCYHCSQKGHIKANCPARKRLEIKPWTRKLARRDNRATTNRGYGTKRGQGRSFPSGSGNTRKRFSGGAQAMHLDQDF